MVLQHPDQAVLSKWAKDDASNKLARRDEADVAHAGPKGTWNGEPTTEPKCYIAGDSPQ